ncbi:DUF4041 domain-containing protein [Clostridium sardiniense]|uniref:DUF4041 domain-containing protein n=1 Tax=Clostridium sardiniense TaxID=29369 RepID=UPI003D3334CE
MDKKFKWLIVALIITSLISAIVPLVGLLTCILALVIYISFSKNEKSIFYKNNLDKEISETDNLIKEKQELLKETENDVLKKQDELNLEKIKLDELKNQFGILKEIVSYNDTIDKLKFKIETSKATLEKINTKITLSEEVLSYKELEKELYTLQVGIFEKKYDYELSEEYNSQLKVNRNNQKDCIKDGLAIKVLNTYSLLDSSLKQSEKNKLINNLCKLALRAFNNESDLIINKLTISNFTNSRKKLESAMDQVNKLLNPYDISINMDYFKLKIEELQLQYEYLVKIQEEREEQREIKEQMREEAKVQAEISKLEKEAAKEEKLYEKALIKVRAELEKASDEEKNKLQLQIQSLEENLKLAEEKMQRAKSMAQQTKSGYVYVISNIGSFGEDVYKIGLTRRLEPLDRVKELSDASVPFSFDVHALIHSDDAPALEKELHNHFNSNRVNKVNLRKEFFNVKLSDIEKVVNDKVNTHIKFTKVAEALEYRQSKQMN